MNTHELFRRSCVSLWSEKDTHIFRKLLLSPFNPFLSQGHIGLSLCEIRRKAGFVPGTEPSLFLGQTLNCQGEPDQKVYIYVPFLD